MAGNGPVRAVGAFYGSRGYVGSHTEHAAFPGHCRAFMAILLCGTIHPWPGKLCKPCKQKASNNHSLLAFNSFAKQQF